MGKQYVQHISGQGEKWEIEFFGLDAWICKQTGANGMVLPKSEYRLCEPPERWVDVTDQCVEGSAGALCVFLKPTLDRPLWWNTGSGYRLRKVKLWTSCNAQNDNTQWAFIVEKKED